MSVIAVLAIVSVLTLVVPSCNEYTEPLPTAPEPITSRPPSQFNIAGHWEADSDQGRRIAFDVTRDGRVVNGRVNLHHDCTTGRWRATFDGFEGTVVEDAFITTLEWHAEDNGLRRRGRVTVSGRFESSSRARGGLINSIDESYRGDVPSDDICPALHSGWLGEKER